MKWILYVVLACSLGCVSVLKRELVDQVSADHKSCPKERIAVTELDKLRAEVDVCGEPRSYRDMRPYGDVSPANWVDVTNNSR